jgi:hypothetical protein
VVGSFPFRSLQHFQTITPLFQIPKHSFFCSTKSERDYQTQYLYLHAVEISSHLALYRNYLEAFRGHVGVKVENDDGVCLRSKRVPVTATTTENGIWAAENCSEAVSLAGGRPTDSQTVRYRPPHMTLLLA